MPGPPPAKEVAERLGIRVEQPERLTGVPGEAPVVVAAYGGIIPPSLLDDRLWLNVHPSLLPRWRGAAPVERAIIAGDRETGVTIHRTSAELDAGPIAAQRGFAIEPDDDAGVVYGRAAEVALDLLEDVLTAPTFRPQPVEGVTYAKKIGPVDRELDWAQPAEQIVNRVRALSPYIGARGTVRGRRLTVWRARPAGADSLLVVDGVELLQVQPEGRRRMTAAEYLRGLR